MVARLFRDTPLLGALVLCSLLLLVFFHRGRKPEPQFSEPDCRWFVQETLGAIPGAEAHEIYRKIHVCVDEGFLPTGYKQIYQLPARPTTNR